MSKRKSFRHEEEDGTDLTGQEVTWNDQTFLILSDHRKASWCSGWGIVRVRDLAKGEEYGLSGYYFDDQGFKVGALEHEQITGFTSAYN
tara:strand:+ start:492 stop:758 length:267 start_codon:yes stop_codon:yes gene_type:complete